MGTALIASVLGGGCALYDCPAPSTIDHDAAAHVSLSSGVYGLDYEPGTTDGDGCDEGQHVWRLSRVWLADVATMAEVTYDHTDYYGAYELTPPAAGTYNLCTKDSFCAAVTVPAGACIRVDIANHADDGVAVDSLAFETIEAARCP